jgi:hypothetical protein
LIYKYKNSKNNFNIFLHKKYFKNYVASHVIKHNKSTTAKNNYYPDNDDPRPVNIAQSWPIDVWEVSEGWR